MTLKLITPPGTEPVSLAEAKLQLRAGDDEDTLITALIVTAREAAQHELGRALITQDWERVLDAFPAAELQLGMPPVQSILQVQYVDAAGALQTLAPAAYTLDAENAQDAFALPALGYSWPATLDTANAVRVRFRCGYGEAAAVPAAVKAWMLLRIGTLYRYREDFQQGSLAQLPDHFTDRLLDPFRVWGA